MNELKILLTVLTLIVIALTIFLHKYYKANRIILSIISIILLIWKISEFSYYYINDLNIYPVEFSHISYFLVSIIIIFNIKKLYYFASSISFIGGISYIITYLFIDKKFNTFNIYMTFISHITLFFIGLNLLLNLTKFNKRDYPYLLIGYILIISYFLLVHYRIIFPSQNLEYVVLNEIIFGTILRHIGINKLTTTTLFIYYLLLITALFIIFGLMYLVNKYFSLNLISLYSFKRKENKENNESKNKLRFIDRFLMVKNK